MSTFTYKAQLLLNLQPHCKIHSLSPEMSLETKGRGEVKERDFTYSHTSTLPRPVPPSRGLLIQWVIPSSEGTLQKLTSSACSALGNQSAKLMPCPEYLSQHLLRFLLLPCQNGPQNTPYVKILLTQGTKGKTSPAFPEADRRPNSWRGLRRPNIPIGGERQMMLGLQGQLG